MTSYPQAPPPPAPPPEDRPAGVSLPSMLVGEMVRDKLITISNTTPRSLQTPVGASEIGQNCRRRQAYRIAGVPVVNVTDPLKAMVGIGVHAVLAAGLPRLDPQRYLTEAAVQYRGVPGQVDAYDRWKRWVLDWKTTSAKRIQRYRTEGVPANYIVQINIYAAGVAACFGYAVDLVALVFLPRDGMLSDVYAWTAKPDRSIADEAIDKFDALRQSMISGQLSPAAVDAWPSPLCRYCPNYNPSATDLALACPGKGKPT